ncbi:acyl-CoA carboxylase subunit epsilon [Streptomyces mirabilis]|uniref:acyl-CoA carboxylase subunit epsilon n=1 Tax=Streptomyces mirabilis TaxID=68239 RepID=UPI0031BA803E
MGTPEHHEPVLRVERGQASDEELAALTVVLLALRAGGAFPRRAGRSTAPAGGGPAPAGPRAAGSDTAPGTRRGPARPAVMRNSPPRKGT